MMELYNKIFNSIVEEQINVGFILFTLFLLISLIFSRILEFYNMSSSLVRGLAYILSV